MQLIPMYYDKNKIIERLIAKIKADIEKQKKSYKAAKHASIDSPGRMQSRYDTMGVESAWVADGLAKALDEKKSYVARLETFPFNESSDRICLGSIVGISSNESPALEYFFILPVASGYELQENDLKITTLTPETPLGKILIGKEVGEEIEIHFPEIRTIIIKKLI